MGIAAAGSKLIRKMTVRDRGEGHRSATPLELLFDLVSVIAFASAAAGLHHAIAENHIFDGLLKFSFAFFSVWWAWMNFTWLASGYDNDDVLYRILTMIMMTGALVIAASVPAFFKESELWLMLTGYIIMRVALVSLWIRAALHNPEKRATPVRCAVGYSVMQVLWIVIVLNGEALGGAFFPALFLGVIGELAVPVYAEKAGGLAWHHHHIAERYGLLIIIVLGETLLSASIAIEAATGHGDVNFTLVGIAVSALVILFAMWWLYFSQDMRLEEENTKGLILWSYGHVIVFGGGVAIGAGFAVLVDMESRHADVSNLIGNLAVAIPIAFYLLGVWLVQDRFSLNCRSALVLPSCAILALVTPFFPFAIEALAALLIFALLSRYLLNAAQR